ncbi:hypothetical protein ACEY7O_09030 [Salmonella enterica subsp. enterica]|uniref:mannitol dehydrogenase family protein n=1 Tax=Salmonella enterica TaxID=28901 RepID=UPI0035B65CF0
MKAVHFGAGNIGRGFIGDLLNNSGYFITFLDVNKPMIDAINKNGSYYFYWIDKDYSKREVTNVAGIYLVDEQNAAIKAIGECDILTTSVWADNLPKIAAVVAKGLKQRLVSGQPKINVMACENALFASDRLRREVVNTGIITDTELHQVSNFVNTSVDRLALTNVRNGETCLDIDSSCELMIESSALVDPKSQPIQGADYVETLKPFIERKLYVVNCGHAAAGYLSYLKGYPYVQDGFADAEIVKQVEDLMWESAQVMIKEYGFGEDEMKHYIKKTIAIWTSGTVKDDTRRVCRSPIRKVNDTDRLVAPAKAYWSLFGEEQLYPKVIAAAYAFVNEEDEQAVELQRAIAEIGIEATIEKYSNIPVTAPLAKQIVKNYLTFKELQK